MPSPRRIPAAAGSGDKENICQDRDGVPDCPTLRPEGAVSTKRKKKPGGFNLRKSIAWNPAFFTEEGVLDNVELSMLSGSQVKANGSPGSGLGGTISPLCRFGKSGNTSVLKEIVENSRGKLPAKFRRPEYKGRQLFSSAKTSDRDERKELTGTQDKRSARSIQKYIPRPPAGYAQKKVPNSIATAQVSRILKKPQPSLPMVPRSTSSVSNISKQNKKLAPVKTEQTCRVEGLPLKSKIKPTSLTKSSGPNIEKDAVPAVTATREEGNCFRKCRSSSPSQNSPSSSVRIPASTCAKPSALRMPSPSVGFFAQAKATVAHGDTAQRNAERCLAGNTSSPVKPPQRNAERCFTGNTSSPVKPPQRNAERCFTGNTSSLVKPPRYKKPEDLESRLGLTKQLPTSSYAALNLLVQPVTSESTLNTLASSFPGLQHANVSPAKESLLKGIVTYSAKSGNTDNQEMPDVGCLSAESGATTQPSSPEKNDGTRNGMPNAYTDASHVEGSGIIKAIEPTEDSHSLKAICSSIIEPVEDSCSLKAICSSIKPIVGSKLSSSCILSQVCTPNDHNCQSKSDSSARSAIDLENSLVGEMTVAVSLPEGNNCTPGPDFLQDFDSCDQWNTECSTMESMECTICVDQVPQCGSSNDIKPALGDSKSDLDDSLCNEAQPTSSDEANTDGGMKLDTDRSLMVKEAQLVHVGHKYHRDYMSTECSPMKQAAPMPCVDQEARAADVSDLKAVTIDSKTESHDSLAEERQPVLPEGLNTEDNMELDTNKLSALECASHIEKNKAVDKSGTDTMLKDNLKHLVPFTEEWLAAMEACGEEVLEQKTGAVQNSPTDKAAPERSPWSPVKRKAQDVGPFDCTKYAKSVRTSTSP